MTASHDDATSCHDWRCSNMQQLAAGSQGCGMTCDMASINAANGLSNEQLDGCLMLQAPAGQPPDVSARLRRACDMAAAADS